MPWVAVLQALLTLAGTLTAYLKGEQLIASGEAKAITKGLQDAQISIEKARKARLDTVREFDKSDGVPDDNDPNLRD